MEQFSIDINQQGRAFYYRIIDKETQPCEFEVHLGADLVAVFEPDEDQYIHICRNPAGLGQEVIMQLADRIEAHYL